MGMVKMKHINIYGPEQDPQQTLEVLAKLACFHPDKDAERINAAAGAAENLYTPLLASTLGLIKDVGGDPALQEYRGRFFEYGAVKDEVEALSAQVAERGKRQAEISAKLATYAQTKTQLYHLTGLHTSVDEIFACKYLKVRFGRIPKDSYLKLPYYDDHSFTFSEYDFDGEYYWGMYFVPESHAKEVDDIFANLYFERMWVPDFVHGTPQDALCAGEKPEGSVGDILLNGFFEMFDTVLSFASNTMSFLRVGGFVLVHAGMMTVVFTLANMTGGVFYVLIVAVGNVFVMALEALFVGIQVLRLEFYEIFSRFFDANGVPFAPLRISLDPAADKAE